MSLLLDTHALIWFLDHDTRLPENTRDRIETTPIVFVSMASLWEIAIKANIGKLELSPPFSRLPVLSPSEIIKIKHFKRWPKAFEPWRWS